MPKTLGENEYFTQDDNSNQNLLFPLTLLGIGSRRGPDRRGQVDLLAATAVARVSVTMRLGKENTRY